MKEPTRRDHLRRSRAIRQALPPGSPASSLGNFARHLHTLAVLISGIVGRKRPPLPPIATQVPEGTKPARRVKRCARWCANAPILEEGSLLPAAAVVLRPRALETVVLVMDGSGVGRGGTALLIHVLDKGRALPLAWRVRQAPKGHVPEALPIAVGALRREGIPAGAHGGLRGDGAFDGTALQATRQAAGGASACRTAMSTPATGAGTPLRLDPLGACRTPGRLREGQNVPGTREAYGRPIRVRGWWAQGYQAPLSGVSTMMTAEAACRWEEKRFRSETCVSDQHRRGCPLHKAQIAEPQRLSR